MDNKIDKKSDEEFLVIQATIYSNKQDIYEKQMRTGEKLTQITEYLKVLTETMTYMMDLTKNLIFSPVQRDKSTPTDPTTLVLANRKDPPLEGGNSTKIGGMWTLKHDIGSPKFYEILIKKEIKG